MIHTWNDRKGIRCLLLFTWSVLLSFQLQAKPQLWKGMKERDVMSFIDSHQTRELKTFTSYKLFTPSEIKDLLHDAIFRDYHKACYKSSWVVDDLDHDGDMDIVLTLMLKVRFEGRRRSMDPFATVALLSGPRQDFKLIVLNSKYQTDYPIYPGQVSFSNKQWLILSTFTFFDENQDQKNASLFRIDTIRFFFGEPNLLSSVVEKRKVRSIIFQSRSLAWTNHWAVLGFSRTGLVSRRIRSVWDTAIIGHAMAQIDTEKQKELFELLDTTPFHIMKEKYRVYGLSDGPTATIDIDYDDGTKRTIEDYGMDGNLSLKTIYKKIRALTEGLNWIPSDTIIKQ